MTEIPAELVAQESTAYDAVQMAGEAVYWLEGRPNGRDVLVRWHPDDAKQDVTPEGMDVASYVHEYGGGAYLATTEEVWFCNAADQRIYHQRIHGHPTPVTPQPERPGSHRYADLALSPDGRSLFCVRERYEPHGVINELVVLPADGQGTVRTIASGWDFYSFPRPSPDGRWLAWTCWNAPYMPWDATWLFVAEIHPDNRLGDPVRVAGGPTESVFQPQWSPDNTLHFISDRSGWWNLYRWQDGQSQPVLHQEAELGVAQWEFGYSTYAFMANDLIAVIAQQGTRQQVQILEANRLRAISLPYNSIKPYLSGHDTKATLIASSPTQTPSVVYINIDTTQAQHLAGATEIPDHELSPPEPFTFPTRDGAHAHGLYYPPTTPAQSTPPPLLVKAHPGPTANFPQRLDWHTQYFTSRGYAVAEVDYRGSTGYGRRYRQALQGQWGTLDAHDCADAATHLAKIGKAHPDRMAIWGASAGGYTALRALTITDTFAAAIARSPVINPATWSRAAPKFQAHHAEGLTGSHSADTAVQADSRPVLMLHGENDRITPAEETQAFAAALGGRARLVTFPNEGHTLRSKSATEASLEIEGAFLHEKLRRN